jgi:molecular chaperone GrpE
MPSSPASEQSDHDHAEEAQQPAETPEAPEAPELEELRAQVAELDDRYKRALADLDNFRKRTQRLADDRAVESTDRLLRGWLDAVDSVERALALAPADGAMDGLLAVLEQMDAILRRQGVRRIGADGEPFDPERHEAVSVRESGATPDRTILDVVRSGYEVGDRLLRPAEVVVSRRTSDD